MARIPLAATVVVTAMVTVVLAGSAATAAASAAVPSNRGWIAGGTGSDGEPDRLTPSRVR
jgi:hypothetical protein